jgi:hypothetical protein
MKLIALLAALCPAVAFSQVILPPHKLGEPNYKSPCLPLVATATDGVTYLTGMSGSDGDFIIKIQADSEVSDTEFQTTTDIQTIGSVGTYASPTANTQVRFGECDIDGHYQLMLHDDHVNKVGASVLTIFLTDGGDTFLDQTWILNQNVADLEDIADEIDDRDNTTEIDDGLTRNCAQAIAASVAAFNFNRTPDSEDSVAGETVYLGADGVEERVTGTVDEDLTVRETTWACP